MRKETSAGSTPNNDCDMCGNVIPQGDASIILNLRGHEYKFDSERCLQTFQKLIEVYGSDFFRPARH